MCEGLGLRTNGAFVEFTVSQPLPVRRPHTLAYLDRPPALLRAAAPPPRPPSDGAVSARVCRRKDRCPRSLAGCVSLERMSLVAKHVR